MKYLIVSLFLLTSVQLKAQFITEEIISKTPEMVEGKVYTGKDVRASKKNHPKGIYINGYGSDKNYPFAKITGDRIVVLFTFSDPYEGDIIYMHAYTYNLKNYTLIGSQSYIYNDGKINSTTYEATIKMTNGKKKGFEVIQLENGEEKSLNYVLGKKRLELGD